MRGAYRKLAFAFRCFTSSFYMVVAFAVVGGLGALGCGDAPIGGDLGSPPDLASPCAVVCAGATPVCDPGSGKCVACVGDGNCLPGMICGVKDGAAACVVGCKIDADCLARGTGLVCCG